MTWTMGIWILVVAALVVAGLVVPLVYLTMVMRWQEQVAAGLGYYGLPPIERDAFKRRLRWHARLLAPVLWLLTRTSRFGFEAATVRHQGIALPKGTCSVTSLDRGLGHAPQAGDIFVATQMRCGTTWMQYLVYEVLRRGDGNLVESGSTLYAVSPWLEADRGVPMEQAPLVGSERPSRIIKTHLPAGLCPFGTDARYIYVARHPVSCFASCADYIAANAGGMTIPPDVLERWFCSDADMWWGSWPSHVAGWWTLAERHDNVLFLRFEDMKRDLSQIVRRVADFLGMQPLTSREVTRIVEKGSFSYMREHRGTFEMHPPHILAVNAELLVRGSADRYADVLPERRARIADWCAERLAQGGGPVHLYGDVAGA